MNKSFHIQVVMWPVVNMKILIIDASRDASLILEKLCMKSSFSSVSSSSHKVDLMAYHVKCAETDGARQLRIIDFIHLLQ